MVVATLDMVGEEWVSGRCRGRRRRGKGGRGPGTAESETGGCLRVLRVRRCSPETRVPPTHTSTLPFTFLPRPPMDTRTASPPDAHTVSTVIGDPQFDHDSVPDKISAYYSLVFPNFTYYLQTLNVTIGRRCIPTSTASSSDQVQVDVDLGPLKSVSRLHAKIEYEEEEERFMLLVLGRNGAWVDGMWSGKGSKVPLSERYAL